VSTKAGEGTAVHRERAVKGFQRGEIEFQMARPTDIARRVAAGLALTVLVAVPAEAASLKLTVAGVRSDAGALMIGLYNSPQGFGDAIANATQAGLLNDRGRLVGVAMRAKTGSQSIIFTDLPPGRYALIVFHDQNEDGRLDEGSWGIPEEGYGFCNNAQGLLSAPSFDAAAVLLDGADESTSISLIYPRSRSPQDQSDLQNFLDK
jgi:uncharacterized protein (DUF2141 family)